MSSEVVGVPLGPEGVMERMRSLQARMNSVFEGGGGFRGAMEGAMGAPASIDGMVGPIGAGAPGGAAPLNPFGAGLSLTGADAPLQGLIQQAAAKHGLDPDLLDALVRQESNYSPTARSHAGAMGLTQLMPGTAKALGVADPFDPAQSLDGGARFLKSQLDRFGSVEQALAAYNAGPGAVMKYGGVPPYAETQAYVRGIMARYAEAKSANAGRVRGG